MRSLLAICGLLFLNSCALGEVEVEQICATKVFKSPQIKANVNYPVIQVGYVSNIDLSEALIKSKKFGLTNVSLSYALLSSQERQPLTFLTKLELFYVRPDGSEEKLGETTDTQNTEVRIVFDKTSSELSAALINGKVAFKIVGTGFIPNASLTPTFSLCVATRTKTETFITDLF